jgi:glycerol-3-phosphate O-acyltransferase/dihydroxyacetone phosphate acyltransferase
VLAALLRAACLALVRLYYPHRSVVGRHHLPRRAGVVLVANHSNGLIDPLLLRIALQRPVRFLAKSTFFDQPLGRFAMESFGSIPVYRAQDLKRDLEDDVQAGAELARQAGGAGDGRNEATFALCRAALAQGQWLALFPEGTSHSDPQLRPLKTGAARIALSAAAEAGPSEARGDDDRQVVLVPVGLSYDSKATFRSGVLLVFGAPIPVHDRLAEYRLDERQAVERLTEDIREALGEVVLEAETRDLLEGVAQLAAWTGADPQEGEDAARRHQRSQALLAGYRRMRARDPDRARRIVSTARDYARALAHLGVRDPWALEAPRVLPGRALGALGRLLLTAPLALMGAALWWVPYRLAGRVAPKITRGEDDLLGTVKILAGVAFIGLFYAAEVVAGGLAGGWRGALTVAMLAPPAGYAAMRFEELAADTAEAWRQIWLRRARGSQVDRLIARRRALADEIARALEDVRPPAR